MRLNKGNKVEVLSCKEVPSGSWYRAEENGGRNYKTIVERVRRKAIRRCPPPLGVSENWIPGDTVEVLDNNSWKMAMVSKVLRNKYFLIRLLGSSREFKVSKSHIRLRRYYQDDRRVMIGKVSVNCEEEKHDENINLKYTHSTSSRVQQTNKRMNALVKDNYSFVRNKGDYQESRIVSSLTPKRGSPYRYSPVEACEEEGRRRRLVATYPSLFPEQVDVVASPPQMLREKLDAERRKPNDANYADSDVCSIGSCSISSNKSIGPVDDTDVNFSDAESVCRLRNSKEELAAEIRRLELHAYRCTIEALYASGPLSWDQEAMVTNLRLSLHISNDEHLTELRNLVSSETSIPIN